MAAIAGDQNGGTVRLDHLAPSFVAGVKALLGADPERDYRHEVAEVELGLG